MICDGIHHCSLWW